VTGEVLHVDAGAHNGKLVNNAESRLAASGITLRSSAHSMSALSARPFSMPSGVAFPFSASVSACKRFTKPAKKLKNLRD